MKQNKETQPVQPSIDTVDEWTKIKIDEAEYLPLAIIEDTEDGDGLIELGERTPENLKLAARIVECWNRYEGLKEQNKIMENALKAIEHGIKNKGINDVNSILPLVQISLSQKQQG